MGFVVEILRIVGSVQRKALGSLLDLALVEFVRRHLFVGLAAIILIDVILRNACACGRRWLCIRAIAAISRCWLGGARIPSILRRVGGSQRLVPVGARGLLRRRGATRRVATKLSERIRLPNQARQLSERIAAWCLS